MDSDSGWVVVGLDNGGTSNNATILDPSRGFLVDRLVETPSRVTEGPEVAIDAMAGALENVLRLTGVASEAVRGVGSSGDDHASRPVFATRTSSVNAWPLKSPICRPAALH